MTDKETSIREQELLARIAELEAENAFLRARIAELEQQLSKLIDSHDSTKTSDTTPSVPAFVKPKHHKKRHKKPGQKPGHTGSYRQRPTEADEIIEVKLEDCPHCHSALNDMKTCEQYVTFLLIPPLSVIAPTKVIVPTVNALSRVVTQIRYQTG